MFLSKLDSVQNAMKLIEDNLHLTDVEEISIHDAHKRVLAEDIMAYHDSPPFDKSAMDGFAVIAEDTFGASQSAPKDLKIIDAIGAGDFTEKTVDFEKDVPHKVSTTFDTFRVDTPLTTISVIVETSAASLRE